MTISAIQSKLAAFFGKTVGDFTVSGTDLSLLAINAAKDKVQSSLDFAYCDTPATVAVSLASGTSIDSISIAPIKRIKRAFIDSAKMRPLKFVSRTAMADDAGLVDAFLGYEDSADWETSSRPWLVQQGQTLLLYRYSGSDETVTVYLDVLKWLADYTAGSSEDWFLRAAGNYLFWESVIDMNHLYKEFVWRQEGNVAPPEKMVEAALAALIDWNGRVIDQSQSVDLL